MLNTYRVACVDRETGKAYTIDVSATGPEAARTLAGYDHMVSESNPVILTADTTLNQSVEDSEVVRQIRDAVMYKNLQAAVTSGILHAMLWLTAILIVLWLLFGMLDMIADGGHRR